MSDKNKYVGICETSILLEKINQKILADEVHFDGLRAFSVFVLKSLKF